MKMSDEKCVHFGSGENNNSEELNLKTEDKKKSLFEMVFNCHRNNYHNYTINSSNNIINKITNNKKIY